MKNSNHVDLRFMKTHFTTLLKSLIYGAIAPLIVSCANGHTSEKLLSYIDTRVGTAASTTHTAGMFGKHTEEYGQTLPAVLEPNGMNFWTPQTQDTEQPPDSHTSRKLLLQLIIL